MALGNTHYGAAGIAAALLGKRRLWFVGIGGVHMAQMALLAAHRGFCVAGSDRTPSVRTRILESAGIGVYYGHDAARVVGRDAVIYTLAVSQDNPEYDAACNLGLLLFSRADFLDFLLSPYVNRIGVAGSHGKSTVTAMLARIFAESGRSAAVFCGADPQKGDTWCVGEDNGRDAVFEACEYRDSFLCLSPTLAVILNAEHDHPDYFADQAAYCRSLAAFAGKATRVLCGAEDVAAMRCTETMPVRYTFGVEHGDYHTDALRFENGCACFLPVMADGSVGGEIHLRVPGRHNAANAMAAVGAAALCGVGAAQIVAGLNAFCGAGRRMEYRGLLRGARIFDDYAHHPTEIYATLRAARDMAGKGRVLAVFQSHTYTRTAAFLERICKALQEADRVWIAEIYAARERDTLGISAAVLARGVGKQARAPGGLAAIASELADAVMPGDVVVVMGAGDIDRIFGEFCTKHFTL